jgi:hypothetical protein
MGYQQEGLERWRTHTGPRRAHTNRTANTDGEDIRELSGFLPNRKLAEIRLEDLREWRAALVGGRGGLRRTRRWLAR